MSGLSFSLLSMLLSKALVLLAAVAFLSSTYAAVVIPRVKGDPAAQHTAVPPRTKPTPRTRPSLAAAKTRATPRPRPTACDQSMYL